MKFLLDQDVYALTERFLREQGDDVTTASDLLKTTGEQERIFITRDRDNGNLVFGLGMGSGVIYMRILPADMDEVHAELKKVLETYSQDESAKTFIVVEKGRHRIRKIEQSASPFSQEDGFGFYSIYETL